MIGEESLRNELISCVANLNKKDGSNMLELIKNSHCSEPTSSRTCTRQDFQHSTSVKFKQVELNKDAETKQFTAARTRVLT